MSNLAIRVEGLGKEYKIGGLQNHTNNFREFVTNAFSAPFRRARDLMRGEAYGAAQLTESIWALKDVSFEVKHGEVIGIIGRNGAGKSTLLKVLSRITEPTEGYVDVYGRVGALLEVGTGFHQELTGRENIYLNGAILGMTRRDIDRKFEEIVEFAGVAKFIDTPVKHYSSGMGLRLGFAVAAHLEPEILVVDEVLAVGDAEFQRKCLSKMQEVGRGGRTILFVSHNMSAIRNICQKTVILERGEIHEIGPTNEVVDHYLAQTVYCEDQQHNVETKHFIVHDVSINSVDKPTIQTLDQVEIRVKFSAKVEIPDPGLYVGILTTDGQRISGLDFKDMMTIPPLQANQETTIGFVIERFPLLSGEYRLEIYVKDMSNYFIELVPAGYGFKVVDAPIYGSRKITRWNGLVYLEAKAQRFVTTTETEVALNETTA